MMRKKSSWKTDMSDFWKFYFTPKNKKVFKYNTPKTKQKFEFKKVTYVIKLGVRYPHTKFQLNSFIFDTQMT